ncbi:unnamed protein product [Cuscuta epithymum]|uniref:F-box domain-containing protein n=1 Tax=Cuscuta epithymum TaxID=186058 RepID=A0AAV0CD91_9ASTE|nr:unnamed protein product [Cuscuta epithymum]
MARKKLKTGGNDTNIAEASHWIFHDDITSEILKRLPARELMQVKCVCKDWMRLIRDPNFAESHMSHARAQPKASYILFMSNTGAFAADHTLSFKNSRVPANPGLFRTHMPCSNTAYGLICFCSRASRPGSRNSSNIVYNLSTGEKRDLPPPTIPAAFKTYALGFDPTIKRYKVLHFGQERRCQILTLERNSSWRTLIDDVPRFQYERGRFHYESGYGRYPKLDSIHVDGKIYFIETGSYQNDPISIRFFDLTSEKFGTIESPPLFYPYYNTPRLAEAGTNLGFVSWQMVSGTFPNFECSFWVLDQNWALKGAFSMRFDMIWGSIGTNKLVLGREGLFLFDMEASTRKKLKKERDEYTHVLCNHIENIFPLSTTK